MPEHTTWVDSTALDTRTSVLVDELLMGDLEALQKNEDVDVLKAIDSFLDRNQRSLPSSSQKCIESNSFVAIDSLMHNLKTKYEKDPFVVPAFEFDSLTSLQEKFEQHKYSFDSVQFDTVQQILDNLRSIVATRISYDKSKSLKSSYVEDHDQSITALQQSREKVAKWKEENKNAFL
ncbi:hypothetical protein A2U01_0012818 [Trifolium medium]|uniref:Uncharacterized protein n=1 Tax=Trifolium medium TaxID=97028 RepID=A0A392MWK1_9FABA|nr:hypothetical protein [Trifolium medium]